MRVVTVTLVSLLALPSVADSVDAFRYVSPEPGSRWVAPGASIILRPAEIATPPEIRVRGARSGVRDGDWVVAEDGAVLIFRPHEPFAAGELVSVELSRGGESGLSFEFTISRNPPDLEVRREPSCMGCYRKIEPQREALVRASRRTTGGGLVLPETLDVPTITVNDDPTLGQLFLGPMLASVHYALVMDNSGEPAFFRELPARAWDFKKHEAANRYSYMQSLDDSFHVLDESFEYLDEFSPGNGYTTLDEHDFQILPNGHVLLGVKDYQLVDMSQIVPGGDPGALVIGLVIQEQDPQHNVVFQWRSFDHFEITDVTHKDLTASLIDPVHWNSIELDTDGNLLISARHMDAIAKIDRTTGDLLWEMGGTVNEFTLVGDTQWFTRQHALRRTAAGTLTLFDNGNFSTPQESRVAEYQVDEVAKVATLVWEHRNDPPLYGSFVGNAQRLPSGNTLVSWGPLGVVSEVRPDGTKAFEMVLEEDWTYRAFRYDWYGVAARPDLWFETTAARTTLHFTKFGDADVSHYNVYRGDFPEPTALVGSTPGNSFVFDVEPFETFYARVTAVNGSGKESDFSNDILVVVPIAVSVPGEPEVGPALRLLQNRPNPFSSETTIAFTIPSGRFVELSIYDVTGRLVQTLARGVIHDSSREIVWDGTDSSARRASAGVYFYRLTAGDRTITRSLTLLR